MVKAIKLRVVMVSLLLGAILLIKLSSITLIVLKLGILILRVIICSV